MICRLYFLTNRNKLLPDSKVPEKEKQEAVPPLPQSSPCHARFVQWGA